MPAETIVLNRHPLAAGGYLAQLTLNAPRALNSLTLEMVSDLLSRLRELAADEDAVAVFLDGNGERAFCAGGDVRRMRASALANPGGRALEAERFFEAEYRMDYLLHSYPKPVICWAHGITMGGGLGMLTGASHRITTGSSKLAMPEVTIGLYPDVGASWFLNRMPGKSGLFCALTGVALNAADALYAGLADYTLGDDSKPQLITALTELDWQGSPEADRDAVTHLLTDIEAEQDVPLPESHLKSRRFLIDDICAAQDLHELEHNIENLHGDDPWLCAASNGLQSGSAVTARLIVEQLDRGRSLTLAQAFQMEMVLSANRVRDDEFIEGVRAQLVDKDRSPQWQYASMSEVPHEEVTRLFTPPWETNPLADLAS